MIIKTEEQLQKMKEIGRICATIRDAMQEASLPGVSTKDLDNIAKELFEKFNAKSAPIAEYDFPGYTCISLNHQVAHGIPSNSKILKDGDLLNIDVSGCKDGYYADTGISFVVGKCDDELKQRVCDVAKESFFEGIKYAQVGKKINQIGKNIHKKIKEHKLEVIENLTGHGIGTALHQEPNYVFNYFDPWDNMILKDGLCLAVEPFVSTKTKEVSNSGRDEWELVSKDGSYVAQYEHTIMIRENQEPLILTKLD
ncbi:MULTISPECIES: type I methionyl aminopeptidase [unclassified Gemella]|uniref:type I methionyl aminopeptidase n=1 Tax=unclassified Gemella TaxID=2624949 RepID=UPI0010743033|nr:MULTISPECIES: type I methionyl aminopeptidase [unclassified Gemella]MBF0710006.1 type I methionyl aminopeptidase [Gemella sp. GL1.1]MBF0746085.1 type I methionyl aminopeptidase [Gemella sp. 19428wG2_WT2a]NYS27350.1 type I methionyl aminopeptidase [Gemella sp. GL1]TFU60376.1 type I methionyl aminopeptidase [Gemella sp. WT2a]